MRLSLGLTPKSYFNLGGAANDADAQAFIDAAGIIDATQKSAVNQLVLDLKSASIWAKMKAIYPIVGGTATTHKWNLKDPRDLDAAFRLTFATGWTHASTGMTPNGTSAYANTFISPNTAFTNYNGSLSYYSRTNNTNSGIDFGSFSVTGNYFMQLYTSVLSGSRANLQRNDSNYVLFSSTDRSGLFTGSITANNSIKIYQNGLLKNSNTVTDNSVLNSVNIYLGCLNNNGTAQSYANRECAFASIGDGLTDTESTLLYQIVEKYQVALGRNINTTQNFYYNGAYDNDTNVYLFRTQITDNTQQTAVNTLVTDLKTYNIWSKMKAVYPVLGGTASTHAVNLTGNTVFNLSFSTGWTHASTGMTPLNAYADTFLTPSTTLSQNSTHISAYSRTNIDSGAIMGTNSGSPVFTNQLALVPRASNGLYASVNQGSNSLIASNTDSRGFYLAKRTTSTAIVGQKNSTQTSVNIASTGLNSFKLVLGANGAGTVFYSYSAYEIAFASIGDGLTDTEAANLYTAVQAYQTTLGRQTIIG